MQKFDDITPAGHASRSSDAHVRLDDEIKSRMLESSPDCIKLLDLDARLLSMNAGGMAQLEICDLGPVIGSQWVDFWEGADRDAAKAALAAARSGQIGRFTGYFPTTVSRRPMWWDVVVSPIRAEDGSVDHLLAVSRDVSARMLSNELVRAVTEGTGRSTGPDFFPSLVCHLASVLRVPYVFVAECTTDTRERVRTLAFWKQSGLAPNFEYTLTGTPCEAVIDGQAAYHADHVQALFPRDRDLVSLGARSYLGLPIAGSSGQILGHLAVLDVAPMPSDEVSSALLRTFASRAAGEMERQRVTAEIARLNQVLAAAAQRAQTLLAVNNAVVLNLTPDALCAAITEALRPVMPFDSIAISLLDESKGVLRLVGAQASKPSPQFVIGRELPLAASQAGHALITRRPVLREDLALSREFPSEDTLLHEGFRASLTVPLVVRGQGIGALSVMSFNARQYTQADADLLQEVANQVALAVENMREYEEIGRLKAQVERENVYLREEIRDSHNFEEIIGSSPALTATLGTVERVAATDTTVLLLGETGTGKELIARAIHGRSPRQKRPLVKVNCGAIPAGLIESELFGHVRGAFTGALEARTGRFELATGGTIFLDEIGELPLDMQVKLLRALQEQEFEPVGSSRTVKVNVRVIAATNRDLAREVEAGRFRADLFYRLNVLPIRVPPLRERREDVPRLAVFFAHRHAKRIGRAVSTIDRESLDRLATYDWPGNVRELENVIERALVLSAGPLLHVGTEALPASRPATTLGTQVGQAPPLVAPWPHPLGSAPPPHGSVGSINALEDVLKTHIIATLQRTGGVIEGPQGAAKLLDMHPNTLRSRLKKLGISASGLAGVR